jgi:hypothetical protein
MVTAIALHWAPDDAMHRANSDFTRVFEDLVGIVPGSRVRVAPAAATARLQGMVPVPAAIWLFLTALLALPAWQRRVRSSRSGDRSHRSNRSLWDSLGALGIVTRIGCR